MLDAKWLDALKLPLKAAIGGAIASGALLALDWSGYLELGAFGAIARPVLIVIAVVMAATSLVGIGDALFAPLREKRKRSVIGERRAVRQQEAKESASAARVQALSRLDHLSKQEIDVVANALRDDSPTFFTYVNSPPVSVLMGKGLVWTPGGEHHQDHYPFSFYDWAWERLQERRDEFVAKADANKAADKAAKEAELRRGRRY